MATNRSEIEEGDPRLNKYTSIRQIGKGSYGEVFLVTTDRKKQYVMKNIKLTSTSAKERLGAEQEASLLSRLKHPNIVSYKESFQDRCGVLHIVMGYCEGGDLCSRLKTYGHNLLPETQVVEWFVQIALALQYLHERNILHRDLKTQNIFLSKNDIIKVGDLGIARVLDGSCDLAHTVIGTPYYMSPELFANQPYNHKSDIWALGCCVYEMASLKHAFSAHNINALMYKIIQGKVPPIPSQYSVQLTELVQHMMARNAKWRPGVHEILRMSFIRRHIKMFLNRAASRKRKEKMSLKVKPSILTENSEHEVDVKPEPRHRSHDCVALNVGETEGDRPKASIQQVKHCRSDSLTDLSAESQTVKDSTNDKPHKVPRPLPPNPSNHGNVSSARQRRRKSKQLEIHGKVVLKSHSSTDINQTDNFSEELLNPLLPQFQSTNMGSDEPDTPKQGDHMRSDELDIPKQGDHMRSDEPDTPKQGDHTRSDEPDCDDTPKQGDHMRSDEPDNPKQGDHTRSDEPDCDDTPKQGDHMRSDEPDTPKQGDHMRSDEPDCDDTPKQGDHMRSDCDDTPDPSSDEVDEYFTLLNSTLHLPAADPVLTAVLDNPLQPSDRVSIFPSGRLADRIRALRLECGNGLGMVLVQQVHDLLAGADPEEAEEDLKEMLGIENFKIYAVKLHQLKLCEDSLFSH